MNQCRAAIQAVSCVLLGLALVMPSTAQEKTVTKKDVPSAVLSAFANAYPQAGVKAYAREVEKGKTYYEIESSLGGESLDVLYLDDGTLAEVEEGVAPGDLPAPVKVAVSSRYSKAKIVKSEKTTRGDVVTYELRVNSGGASIGLVVAPDGKIKREENARKKQKEEGHED